MNEMIEKAKEMWPEFFEVGEAIKLGNGETLVKRYDKYEPLMCFLLSEENIGQYWLDIKLHTLDLNIRFDSWSVEWLPGEYWISKKGTHCFRPNENGPHILVRTSWGGCFEPSRGKEFEEIKEHALYARRASSNGGGSGYNYYVFPSDWRMTYDIDEI